MPQNAFFFSKLAIFWSAKKWRKDPFFPTHHPLSTVIFATATVLAFVLLRDSRFNFHHYTQREATPTQKSARKCTATSRNFLRERLQSAFKPALPNIPNFGGNASCMPWGGPFVKDAWAKFYITHTSLKLKNFQCLPILLQLNGYALQCGVAGHVTADLSWPLASHHTHHCVLTCMVRVSLSV